MNKGMLTAAFIFAGMAGAQAQTAIKFSLDWNHDCELLETSINKARCNHASDKVLAKSYTWGEVTFKD